MSSTLAQTILTQLGGNRFAVMTGAKKFIATQTDGEIDGLLFSIPTNATKANRCKITYNAGRDLYSVRFISSWFDNQKREPRNIVKVEHHDVFCDELIPIFEGETGLYTVLY